MQKKSYFKTHILLNNKYMMIRIFPLKSLCICVIFYLLIITLFFEKSLQTNKSISYTYDNITSFEYYNNFVYTYENKHSTKNELLELKNEYYSAFYCKNDICVRADNQYNNKFIEFPDENGNIKLYIIYTCTYDNIKLKNCFSGSCAVYNDIEYYISYECNSNSECLSNKCFNNYCVYNDEEPIVHCDNIYIQPSLFKKESSYIYCGKVAEDTCKINDECSSKKCNNGYCEMQLEGPSDGDGANFGISISMIGALILFIIIICGFCCCSKKSKK